MNRSKNFSVVAVLFIVLLGGLGFYLLYKRPTITPTPPPAVVEVVPTKIRGQLRRIEGNKIILTGENTPTASSAADLQNGRSLSFLTNESTVWAKRELAIPSYDSLRASGETYRRIEAKDMIQKESAGSLGDLNILLAVGAVFVEADFLNFSPSDLENTSATKVVYQIIRIQP